MSIPGSPQFQCSCSGAEEPGNEATQVLQPAETRIAGHALLQRKLQRQRRDEWSSCRLAMDGGGLGSQTSSSHEDSTMLDGGVVGFSLFQQVLFFLLSLISAGTFPLEVLGLLPPLQRRKLFLLLPVVDLHRLERRSPSATEGIDMAKIWEEIFDERLCRCTRWLTEPLKLRLNIGAGPYKYCYLSGAGRGDLLSYVEVCRVLFAVPFKKYCPVMGRTGGFEQIKHNTCERCHRWDCHDDCTWCCKNCKQYKFYCSPKYLQLFPAQHFHSAILNKLDQSFLEAATVLLDTFPFEIDTLSVDSMTETPPINIAEAPFCYLLGHISTLEIRLFPNFSEDSKSFLEALLEVLVSKSTLQNFHLDMCVRKRSIRSTSKPYGAVIQTIALFFSPGQNVIPFLKLRTITITANFSQFKEMEIKKLGAIINNQQQLESLEISSVTARRTHRCFSTHKKIFQVMLSCFLKSTFQCLTLDQLHINASALLDVEQHFLNSTACKKQQLVLKNVHVHSFDERKGVTYAPESAACTKSLSVIRCSMDDVGLFSAADIASAIFLYPGIQEVKLSDCLDHIDVYKLAAALAKETGTLRVLDLSGFNLSSITVRASPLLDAIFHLPHLSELELVLGNCHLQAEDFDQLFCEWEKASCRKKSTRTRKQRCRQSLRKLCVCGNSLPVDTSNLEVMANTLC